MKKHEIPLLCKYNFRSFFGLLVALCCLSGEAAELIPRTAESLMREYELISLTGNSDSEIEGPLWGLLDVAESLRDNASEDAEFWIACARVRFGYANTQGPFKGTRLISEVRKELERAILLDSNELEGYALAFLGYLYASSPPWPLGFGDIEEAKKLLEQAISVNDKNVPNNYFYAVYLYKTENYINALERLAIADAVIDADSSNKPRTSFFAGNINELKSEIERKIN